MVRRLEKGSQTYSAGVYEPLSSCELFTVLVGPQRGDNLIGRVLRIIAAAPEQASLKCRPTYLLPLPLRGHKRRRQSKRLIDCFDDTVSVFAMDVIGIAHGLSAYFLGYASFRGDADMGVMERIKTEVEKLAPGTVTRNVPEGDSGRLVECAERE